jgi:hypothetical protein
VIASSSGPAACRRGTRGPPPIRRARRVASAGELGGVDEAATRAVDLGARGARVVYDTERLELRNRLMSPRPGALPCPGRSGDDEDDPWRSNAKSAPMRDSTESLDVLHLLSQALDFALGLDHEARDLELIHLRARWVDLAWVSWSRNSICFPTGPPPARASRARRGGCAGGPAPR